MPRKEKPIKAYDVVVIMQTLNADLVKVTT